MQINGLFMDASQSKKLFDNVYCLHSKLNCCLITCTKNIRLVDVSKWWYTAAAMLPPSNSCK